MGSDGGCGFAQETLDSPVQAVTVLVERADGTVDADLVIISTEGAGSHFVETAEDAELRVPGGALVALELDEPGHYRSSSDVDPALVYAGGTENYRVTFDLDDPADAGEAAGDDFVAVVQAPGDDVTLEFSKLPEFAGDTATVQWSPAGLDGLLEIRDPHGELVYTSFDLSTPDFDGSKWMSLLHGGIEDLSVSVFADPGTYTVSFCGVASQEGFDEELSAALGVLSGFLAGRCIEDVTLDVAE
jgi:hypothetical protein